jgi:hypothetical protein
MPWLSVSVKKGSLPRINIGQLALRAIAPPLHIKAPEGILSSNNFCLLPFRRNRKDWSLSPAYALRVLFIRARLILAFIRNPESLSLTLWTASVKVKPVITISVVIPYLT